MSDCDPIVVAERVVEEHGLKRAIASAMECVSAAEQEGDEDSLRLRREVEVILREQAQCEQWAEIGDG